MTKTCKYVALKNYIPQGLPSEDDFEIKTKEIKLNNKNNLDKKNVLRQIRRIKDVLND